MVWSIIRTDRFSEEFKKFEKNKQFVDALNKKIIRLQEDPNIGGYLSGRLHGYKSVRLVGKFRMLFRINEKERKVYLIAIDHQSYNYERF